MNAGPIASMADDIVGLQPEVAVSLAPTVRRAASGDAHQFFHLPICVSRRIESVSIAAKRSLAGHSSFEATKGEPFGLPE